MSGWSSGSSIYGGAWSTPEMNGLFDDVPRTRAWLEILAVLAEVQGSNGLIPSDAAAAVARGCRSVDIDAAFLDECRLGYEATGHSTAGLIDAMRRRLPDDAHEWFYFGATVQDVTDTWMMLALAQARLFMIRDLDRAITAAAALCREHRDTVMLGRTHGQHGLPITFGFKVAGWLAEMHRHRCRFDEIVIRMNVGQLCGGVGSLSALGPKGLIIQAAFCQRVGLYPPEISWTASRDIVVEWAQHLALLCGIADRVGHEVYSLQRDEIGELSEGARPGQVSSITMPHKRNPEIAEHMGTLARVVRANASLLGESLVHDHERDGRSWKVEWHAVPDATCAAGKAVTLLADLLENLVVHADVMRTNLVASGGHIYSEVLMLGLAQQMGKNSAHQVVHRLAQEAADQGIDFSDVVRSSDVVRQHLDPAMIEQIFNAAVQTAQCGPLVDRVLGGGRP